MPRIGGGRRHWPACGLGVLAAIAFAGAASAFAAHKAAHHRAPILPLAPLIASGQASVETVYFKNRREPPVRVIRGAITAALPPGRKVRTEILSFGPRAANRVTVLHGTPTMPVSYRRGIETIKFADPLLAPVTIIRGPSFELTSTGLFGAAKRGELDRIAFAVDGIESRHGADARMWRAAFDGPQGPMQVSAAAALDVGGGDRFDLRQNRLLGRAYLAQLFRRYGNWPDAVAAYNWGPANLDQWIAGGRDPDRLPPGVAYYVARVLRDAVITAAAGP